jgi:hypothetical protein
MGAIDRGRCDRTQQSNFCMISLARGSNNTLLDRAAEPARLQITTNFSASYKNATAYQSRQRGAEQRQDDWLDRTAVEVVKLINERRIAQTLFDFARDGEFRDLIRSAVTRHRLTTKCRREQEAIPHE